MTDKGAKKPADNENNGHAIEPDVAEGNGNKPHDDSGFEDRVDWSLDAILNHPKGVDYALTQNLALMEQQTKDLIENGSVEELMMALEENNRQLELLREKMNISFDRLSTIA